MLSGIVQWNVSWCHLRYANPSLGQGGAWHCSRIQEHGIAWNQDAAGWCYNRMLPLLVLNSYMDACYKLGSCRGGIIKPSPLRSPLLAWHHCWSDSAIKLFSIVRCSILHPTRNTIQSIQSNPICPLIAPQCYICLWCVIQFQQILVRNICENKSEYSQT